MRQIAGDEFKKLGGPRPEYAETFRDPWEWAQNFVDSYEFEGVTEGSAKEQEILTEMPSRDPRGDKRAQTKSERYGQKTHPDLLQNHQQAHLFRKMNYLRKRACERKQRSDMTGADQDLTKAWLLRQAIAGEFFDIVLKIVADLEDKYPDQDTDRLYDRTLDFYYRYIDRHDYAIQVRFDNWTRRQIFARIEDQVISHKSNEPVPGVGHSDETWEQLEEQMEQRLEVRYDPEAVREFIELILKRLEEYKFGYKQHPLAAILRSRYLIKHSDEKGATLQEIAKAMGITHERVRQLEENAFKIIREIIAKQSDIQPYLEKFDLTPEDIELLFLRKRGKPFTPHSSPAGSPGTRGKPKPRRKLL